MYCTVRNVPETPRSHHATGITCGKCDHAAAELLACSCSCSCVPSEVAANSLDFCLC